MVLLVAIHYENIKELASLRYLNQILNTRTYEIGNTTNDKIIFFLVIVFNQHFANRAPQLFLLPQSFI